MTDTHHGFVSLVGAGPGDEDLLTLRAVDRLRRADVVLYDDLASDGALLAHARPEADLISVGKRAGLRSPRQSDVSDLIIAHAMAGQRVVRLKSGDPSIFGRADEELEVLRAAGIDHEIVPGVTTATAASAAAGVSLTRRLVARRLQFVTGHDVDGHLPADLNLPALADVGATTCVFMGKATFPMLAEQLVAHGLSPETPALMAESLGRPQQTLTRGTIAELAARLSAVRATGPCMIVYGMALGATTA